MGANATVAGEFVGINEAVFRFAGSQERDPQLNLEAGACRQCGVAGLVGQGAGDEVGAVALKVCRGDGDRGGVVVGQIIGLHGVGHGEAAARAADLEFDGIASQGASRQFELHLQAIVQVGRVDDAVLVFGDGDDQWSQSFGLNDDGLGVDTVVGIAGQGVAGVAGATGVGDGGAEAVGACGQFGAAGVPDPVAIGVGLDQCRGHDGVAGIAQFELDAGVAAQASAYRCGDGAAVDQRAVTGEEVAGVGAGVFTDAVDADGGAAAVDDLLDVGESERVGGGADLVGDGAGTAADQAELGFVEEGDVKAVVASTAVHEVVAIATGNDDVVAIAALQGVITVTTVEGVVALAAVEDVVAVATVKDVIAVAAVEAVVAVATAQGVIAVATAQGVISAATAQAVITVIARQGVIALATAEAVVAIATAERVVTVVARQGVVALATVQGVVAVAA